MRPLRLAPLLLATLSILSAANEAQARYEGSFNLFVGQKWLSQRDWAPVDKQSQLGLMLAFGEERASVHFAIDLFVSKGDSAPVDPTVDAPLRGSITELAIGVRKVWGRGATRPHLGGGADFLRVHEDRNGPSGPQSNDARGYGAWVDGGVSWRLARHFNLGLEARYSASNVDLGSGSRTRDVATGGTHVGLLLGYGW